MRSHTIGTLNEDDLMDILDDPFWDGGIDNLEQGHTLIFPDDDDFTIIRSDDAGVS